MIDNSKVHIKRIEGLPETIEDIYEQIEEAKKSGTALSVGQIVWSQSNIKSDHPGLLPLFTGESVLSADYPTLYNFLLRHPELCTDQTTYNTLATDPTRDCPYYYIGSTTISLPILRNYLNSIRVTPESTIPDTTETVTTNFYGWSHVTSALYAWENVTYTEYGNIYTASPTPQVGDNAYTANGTIVTAGDNHVPMVITSVSNDSFVLDYGNGTSLSLGYVGYAPWTYNRLAASNDIISSETIYTLSNVPAVADDVYSSINAAATGVIDAVGTDTITATISSTQATYNRDQSADDSVSETVVIPGGQTPGVLEITKPSLYPWVSYIEKPNDIPEGKPLERPIGEIVKSALPIIDAGYHLLDGSLLLGDGVYRGFVNYISDLYAAAPSANYFTTEQDWQDTVSEYGVCGKFVYDSVNNTVRLPKVEGFIEGTLTEIALGNVVEAGLPNITGTYQGAYMVTGSVGTGALQSIEPSNAVRADGVTSETGNRGIGFDAMLSNAIYGNANTVQPQAVKALYYIVVANFVKLPVIVDIDQIITDLAQKANTSLSNLTAAGMALLRSVSTGTNWSAPVSISLSLCPYTFTDNGWLSGSLIGTGLQGGSLYVNNIEIGYQYSSSYPGEWSDGTSFFVRVNSGDILTYSGNLNLQNCCFLPDNG